MQNRIKEDKNNIGLNISVHGDFTIDEGNELKRFFYDNIIGKEADYKTLIENFCSERYYIPIFDKAAHSVSIYK